MNKMTSFLTIAVIILSFTLGMAIKSSAQQKSFAGVIPFVTSTNRVGFFDQNSGKVFMYDDNISQCVFVGQLSALGQPIQSIAKSQNLTTSNPSAL